MWKPVLEQGPMYGHSFTDSDGHVWEVMHMDLAASATSSRVRWHDEYDGVRAHG